MLVPVIDSKPKGFVVRSKARDFPCLDAQGTRNSIPAANAQHFPDDPVWQRHCELMARFKAADLRPFGLAPAIPARLDAIPVVGRAA